MNRFDIVIPVGPNDIHVIPRTLEYNKKNILNYRNIYIVTNTTLVKEPFKDCILIDENTFPFNMNTVKKYLGHNNRCGWYLQQLLKLYSGCITGILNDYLVVDSDTVFLRETTFFDGDIPLYNFGTEHHKPYFHHMVKLHPSLSKLNEMSGICHHLMFQKDILNDLFDMVEGLHGKPFYDIFLWSVDRNEILGSGASEYEIYFNFLQKNYPGRYKIRELKWSNVSSFPETPLDFDYVSCHWYMRR